ncbi:hypothetical protein B0H19DRAFT_715330 [Mycena capillaripes]|nr:hypothetical protein B0H19DRAFT_715330 [Mycena capillaripes]
MYLPYHGVHPARGSAIRQYASVSMPSAGTCGNVEHGDASLLPLHRLSPSLLLFSGVSFKFLFTSLQVYRLSMSALSPPPHRCYQHTLLPIRMRRPPIPVCRVSGSGPARLRTLLRRWSSRVYAVDGSREEWNLRISEREPKAMPACLPCWASTHAPVHARSVRHVRRRSLGCDMAQQPVRLSAAQARGRRHRYDGALRRPPPTNTVALRCTLTREATCRRWRCRASVCASCGRSRRARGT